MALLKTDDLTNADRKQPSALHTLKATVENCHWGYFSATQAPAIKVKSGDLIQAEAVTHHAGDAPDLMMDDALKAVWAGIPEEDRNPGVHLMTGPIYVEGAQPGDIIGQFFAGDVL